MKKLVEKLQKDPARIYTIADIQSQRLIPWARHQRTIKKLLISDKKGLKVLNCRIIGDATQRRYLVRGESIIRYLQVYGPILSGTARKIHGNKTKRKKGDRARSEKSRA